MLGMNKSIFIPFVLQGHQVLLRFQKQLAVRNKTIHSDCPFQVLDNNAGMIDDC